MAVGAEAEFSLFQFSFKYCLYLEIKFLFNVGGIWGFFGRLWIAEELNSIGLTWKLICLNFFQILFIARDEILKG